MMLIATLRPTRGIEFSQSADSIAANLSQYPHLEPKRTWDEAIPKSFNLLAEWFMQTGATHAWFVEEDVVVPDIALYAMLGLNVDIAAINYPLKTDGRISEMRRKDVLLWVSLGCTLIRRRVFETLPRPWFSTDYALVSSSTGSACKEKILSLKYAPRQYAGQDMYFCFRALEAGFTIGAVEGMLCEHLRLDAMGEANTNDGCHKISRV